MNQNQNHSRSAQLQKELPAAGIDALLVASMPNIRYLTGFASDERDVALLLVTGDQQILITDYRFAEQAREECRNTEVIVRDRAKQTLGQLILQLALKCQLQTIGYEREHFLHGRWLDLARDMQSLDLKPFKGVIEFQRRLKDISELSSIRSAAAIGDQALDHVLGILRPGMSEKEAAIELEYAMMRAGSEGLAFPTIFTSGPRTSRPHGMPSDKKLATGELITIDFGAVVNGYHSDMTRSVVLGKADAKQREVYQLIQQAQALGVECVRAGIPCSEPTDKVSAFLSKCPYGKFAGDGLGHSLGLETHEQPYLVSGNSVLLEENFVVTVEPGIYIPGWGGVRIEDDVRVTATGCEVLTNFPKDLLEI